MSNFRRLGIFFDRFFNINFIITNFKKLKSCLFFFAYRLSLVLCVIYDNDKLIYSMTFYLI
jgi:hypothetical protein